MAAEALEQSVLESKDKDQLLAIAKALGLSTSARNRKAEIIQLILDTTNTSSPTSARDVAATAAARNGAGSNGLGTVTSAIERGTATNGESALAATAATEHDQQAPGEGEPPAEWELALAESGSDEEDDTPQRADDTRTGGQTRTPEVERQAQRDDASAPNRDSGLSRSGQGGGAERGRSGQSGQSEQSDGQGDSDGESRNRRRRRRRKGGGRDQAGAPQGDDQYEQGGDEQQSAHESESVPVAGYLDLRDEGYGFLRVKGYLASKEDAYVPVRLARQIGLRRGDHVTGTSRPAQRNEKNPALLEVHAVNGQPPESARGRRRFEDLTALFPDERLNLQDGDPTNMTARIIDLVAPIGKGQRGLIVSPPKAGKTTVMKIIASSIETNHPEVKLIVLLIDERPEEVTDMRRMVKNGEVISSTFDRPSEEHTHVAELAIEKAKRLVEMGHDVVVILDGITRLSRAYNLAAPASGRILSGGIDAGALYPPKRFFGAARNIEEGGSLTILATALVETNSRMDEAIFEEFKGTGNMELRLDRRLAERRVYPAIDVDASSTRHEELLFDRMQLQQVWKLRRVLSGLAADGNPAPGLELLMDRLKTFRSNSEFLAEIGKQAAM
ncbi:MAG: transcription termination factor Rho [Actinomycetota bacterium]|nr:transcription termination factor Rho [Actinomycetota bacterium]